MHVTVFAECQLWGTKQRAVCRVSPYRHSANKNGCEGHPTVTVVYGRVRCTWRSLPSVFFRHSAKMGFAECPQASTRQRAALPSANWPALGKDLFRWVPVVHRVIFGGHSTNSSFAECSRFCTQQRTWHSAYVGFPVVTSSKNMCWITATRSHVASHKSRGNTFEHRFIGYSGYMSGYSGVSHLLHWNSESLIPILYIYVSSVDGDFSAESKQACPQFAATRSDPRAWLSGRLS